MSVSRSRDEDQHCRTRSGSQVLPPQDTKLRPWWSAHNAEHIGQRVMEEYERIGDRNYLVGKLGETALNTSRLGRPEEALEMVKNGRRIGSEGDITDRSTSTWPRRMREQGRANTPRPGPRSNPRGSGQREPE